LNIDGKQRVLNLFLGEKVTWVEAAGARVVPIPYDAPEAELDLLFASVNGIIFTGGETKIKDLNGQYMQTAGYLLNKTNIAKREHNDHIPLWGTCMGLQTLSILVSQDASVLSSNAFDSEAFSIPLDLNPDVKPAQSRILQSLSPTITKYITTENITCNLHHDGVAPSNFKKSKSLTDYFHIISTNFDRKGKEFVSTIEAKDVPVYGAQWHPERPQFEFSEVTEGEQNIDHGAHAVKAMQAFARFFVGEARMNDHAFASFADEQKRLIYNFVPQGTISYQAYVFPPSDGY
jgi:gamma-glutamyl hydrolase